MSSASFHRRIATGFVLVIVCAAAIAGASLLALRSIRRASEQVAGTYARQLVLVERLQGVVERKAAAARALLMSDDALYVERMSQARAEAKGLIAELRRLVQSPEGQQDLAAIERADAAYQKDIEDVLALRRSGAGVTAVTQHWRLNAALRHGELGAAVQSLRTRKEALLDAARQSETRSAAMLTRLVIAMTAVSLVLAAILAFIMSRTLVRMYDAEALAREAADDARQWFATTLSSIGDAVIATDTRGNVTFVNGAAELMTAWDRADALGKPIEEVFPISHEKTGARQENPIQRVLQTGVTVQLANSTVLTARDGTRRPIDDSAAPIRDAARRITGVVLVFRDISERRRAEAAIRESREWLATTVRSIGDAVIATDNNGRITLMNPIAQKLTGWTEAQAIGAPLEAVFNIVNEQTRKRLQSPVEKVLATGQIVGLANHTVLIAKDGTEWPLDDSGAPIRDAQGEVMGVVLVFREITERRRAEETLRRLSAIVESSDDAIIGKTIDGVITSWNSGAEKLYGYSPEEVLGRPVSLLVPENHPDEMPDILLRLARGERIDHFETVRKCKDGRLVDVFLNVSPIHDDDGRVVGASTIARDIAQKKKAAEALRASEARFRSIYQQAAVGIEQVGVDGRLLMVNEALGKMLGRTQAELLSRTFEDITHPDDREQERKLLDAMFSGRASSYELEKRYLAHDGSPVWVAVTSALVRDGAGQPAYRISVVQNIDARKQAELALHRASEDRRLAVEAANLGAWDYHFDTGDVLWDERCRNMFGYSEGEQIDYAQAIARIHRDDQAATDQAVKQALAGHNDGVYYREFRVVWPDGSTHWIASYGRVYFEGKGEHRRPLRFLGMNAEITEHKRKEEALIRSEKLASVGRMAATIAHEINNPLEAVVNSIYLALHNNGLTPEARAHLEVADEQLARVAELTKQTLAFYRETKGQVVVKLPELLEDVLSFYQRKLREKSIALYTEYDVDNGHVSGTPGELRQVVANLVSNSLDALPSGGRLHVRVRRCTALNGGPAVRLTIADTGTGIAPENVDKIFDPFFTTKEAVGTGLGLWITKEIVSRHGGRVAVRSRPGRGTVFCLYLPAATKAAATAAS